MPTPEENVLTGIELALKGALSDPLNISLDGNSVPVRIVTPDPDFVEMTPPLTTLQLVDIRRGLDRATNEFEVEKNEPEGTAAVRWPESPYDLSYTVRGHTEGSRQDRLLLEQYARLIDAHPVMETAEGRKFYLSRSLAFRERSTERQFEKALTFVVKARLPVGVEAIEYLVQERIFNVAQTGEE